MGKYLILLGVLVLLLNSSLFAQEEPKSTPLPGMRGTPINLPDISVIGDILGQTTTYDDVDRNKVFVREIEFALQGYLYPEIRADVFFAFDREKGGKINTELEEAYVSFLKLFGDFNGKAGRMLVDFGKVNKLHPEQWQYVIKPKALENFMAEHGLIGNGGSLGYLLPLPFFAQFDLGAYRISSEESEEFALGDFGYSARLWTSFSLSEISEFEIGTSGLYGRGFRYLEHQDDVKLYGIDLTYKVISSTYERLIFQNEILHIVRQIPTEEIKRFGFYNFLGYRFNKYMETGLRYDFSENVLPDKAQTKSITGIITTNLTETTKLRFQYGYNIEPKTHELFLQLLFGIGPHSHVLQ